MSHAYHTDARNRSSAPNNGMRKSASHGELYGLTCKVEMPSLELGQNVGNGMRKSKSVIG